MPYDRKSKIAEVWRHPVGQDMLRGAMRRLGKPEDWPEGALVARMPLAGLDRFCGAEFVDLLLEVVNLPPESPGAAAPEQPAWWKQAVAYQIYIPSFMDSDHDGVGDLGGVCQRLPYLDELGVDTLWLSTDSAPGADIPAELLALPPKAPLLNGLQQLLESAHERGMRVVASVDIGHVAASLGNTGDVPEQDIALRKYIARLLGFWKDQGIDGFCLMGIGLPTPAGKGRKAVCASPSVGPLLHLWLRELRAGLSPACPLLVAGIDGIGPDTAKSFTAPARAEVDMVLDTCQLQTPAGLLEAIGRRKRGGSAPPDALSLGDLKTYCLRWIDAYGEGFWMPLLFGSPDFPRIISRLGANPIYRTPLAKLLGTWMLTLRGTPLLYQGEELGLANIRFASFDEVRDERSRSLYKALRPGIGDKLALELSQRVAADHARIPFPWSTGVGAGFTGAAPWMRLADGIEHLNATHQMGDASSVWNHYRQLIALRRENPALVYGAVKPVFAKNKKVFCFFRMHEGEKWYVEINLTGNVVARPGRVDKGHRLSLSNYDAPLRQLRPYEANLYHVEG